MYRVYNIDKFDSDADNTTLRYKPQSSTKNQAQKSVSRYCWDFEVQLVFHRYNTWIKSNKLPEINTISAKIRKRYF